MARRKRLIPFLLLSILCSIQLQTAAVTPQSSDIIPTDALLIRNSSNQPIAFWLRNGDGAWYKFELNAGANRIYKNLDQIWISTTGQEPVHYKLELQQRYKIIWNGTKWDLRRIAIR